MILASRFLLLAALLYGLGVFLSGFAAGSIGVLATALVYIALSFGLMRGWMWVAWLAFFAALAGAAGAVADVVGVSPVPLWLSFAVLAVNLVVAVLLFVAIWSGPAARDPVP